MPEGSEATRRRPLAVRVVRFVAGAVAAGIFLWTLGAFLVLGPEWLATIFLVGVPLLLLLRDTRRRGLAVLGVAFALALALFLAERPSNDRDWQPNEARTAWAEVDGDRVTIHNVRNTRYRTEADYDPVWETRLYDLGELEGVDFFVVPFPDLPGGAHTFVSFAFGGGERVAISIEARKERGETYGILPGLYRQFELIYVVADERDVVGLRSHVRGEVVRIYPMRSTPEGRRAFFLDMIEAVNRLHREPEFYNVVTRTCASTLVEHLDRVRSDPVGFSLETLLPGLSDRKVIALGLVDGALGLEEARRRYRVDPSVTTPAAEDFSDAIRRPPAPRD